MRENKINRYYGYSGKKNVQRSCNPYISRCVVCSKAMIWTIPELCSKGLAMQMNPKAIRWHHTNAPWSALQELSGVLAKLWTSHPRPCAATYEAVSRVLLSPADPVREQSNRVLPPEAHQPLLNRPLRCQKRKKLFPSEKQNCRGSADPVSLGPIFKAIPVVLIPNPGLLVGVRRSIPL